MNQRKIDQTLALAGVVQAAVLVHRIAYGQELTPSAYEASLKSVFELNAESTEAIFGGKASLRIGLYTLQSILNFEQHQQMMPIIRYALSLLNLADDLARQDEMQTTIRQRLHYIQTQLSYSDITDEKIIAALATLYQDTISTFNTRIKVSGTPVQLKNAQVANQIRALLLCGIRAAFLWRQLGGKRWQLFFSLGSTGQMIEQLLQDLR